MLLKFKIIFILLFIAFSPLFSQQRYAENQVVTHHDTLYLKKDMQKITGIVYNNHGEIGEFRNGLREGMHREWFRSGNLKDEISYKDGLKDGEYRHWSDHGQLVEEGHYVKGKLNGLIKEWYKNGNIKLEVNYKNGEMNGLRTEWYKSGHKWSEQQMENGYVVWGKHFYNDESVITHGNFIKH